MTFNELDDILKIIYPKDLCDKDLKHVIKKFSSIQNKILIDYKAFRTWLKNNIIKNLQKNDSGFVIKKDAILIKRKIFELKEKLNKSFNKEKKINSLIEDYWKNKN